MTEQLFPYDGVTPRSTRSTGRRLKRCAIPGCDNWARNTQAAKYCTEHATSINYELRQERPTPVTGPCLACGVEVTRRPKIGQRPLLLCSNHVHLAVIIGKWRTGYHLSDEQIRQLTTDATCWICERSLRWRFQRFSTDQREQRIVVDHDHGCCPGPSSCGKCVRGLAHEGCNRRLGPLEALLDLVGADRLRALIDQLTIDP